MKIGGIYRVCSLTLSETLDAQLQLLDAGQSRFIERNMVKRAHEASVEQAGTLDAPQTHLRSGFDADLLAAGVRKEQIGRHRVFFTGTHKDCNYTAFFVKLFKRRDDDAVDDNNPTFHTVLTSALNTPNMRRIADPNQPAPEPEAPAWQNAEWYRKYIDNS